MQNAAIEIFLDSWRIYKKIVAHNYMYHVEFNALTKKYLEKKFGSSSVNILDLGCGDASAIYEITKDLVVNSYTGYDLSDTALEYARKKLESVGFKYALVQKDILDAIEEVNANFEIVYSSYALHHLEDREKQKAIDAIYALLVKGGVFIYIDICRRELETREEYLHGYINWIYSNWSYLSADEKALIRDHVLNNDYPSTEEWIKKVASDSGYTINSSPVNYNKHQLWLLEKN